MFTRLDACSPLIQFLLSAQSMTHAMAPLAASSDTVTRALGYPFARPRDSFLFTGGEARPLPTPFTPDPSLTAVIGYGSNAAPEHLRRKYGINATIPVVSVLIHGLDVVYAAGISAYGSVPATVRTSPDTQLTSSITLLDKDQLTRMHGTEGGYLFCRLRPGCGVRVTWNGADFALPVMCYVTKALLVDGVPIALKAMAASGRTFTELEQRDMQEKVIEIAGLGESVDEFIERNVMDPDRRFGITGKMESVSKLEPCWERIEDLGSLISAKVAYYWK